MAWNSLKALTVLSLETLIYWVIIGNLMFMVYFVMYFAVSYTTTVCPLFNFKFQHLKI